MDRLTRSFPAILFITIISFAPYFSNTGYGLDSLRVGLVFQTPDPNQADSLSNQLIRIFHENSQLKVVPINKMDSNALQSSAIDSSRLTALKQQQLQGLILCKVSRGTGINKLGIEALAFDDLKTTRLAAVDLDAKDLSNKFMAIVREIDAAFQRQKRNESALRIIFAPMSHSVSDSSQLQFQRSLCDSLKKTTASPLFSKIELVAYAMDSLNQSNWKDSSLQQLAKSNQAHLILAGKIDKDEQRHKLYHPRLSILKKIDTQNPARADERLLSGKTCQIKQFDLPAISLDEFFKVADFIKGYFLIQEKKYSDAMEYLKSLQSFAACFYLAESYFYRGVTKERDRALAQADWDSSICYWRQCLSKTDSYADAICANNNLGVVFQLSGHRDSALVYFARANSDWQNIPDKNDFIQISQNLGNCYLLNGQWNKALDTFQSAVHAMEQSHDSLNLAMTYENLGHIYQLIVQRNKAIDYYNKALELRKKMNDEAAMASSFNFLGNAYHGNKDFKLAKDYFKQSLALSLEIHHEPQLASTYDNLGQVFQATGDLDSALFYFQKSYDTYSLLDDQQGSVQTMLHQALVYQKQKAFDKAIAFNEKALNMIGTNNANSLRAQIYDRLGDIYNHQQNLIPALDHYQQAAELYEKASNFQTLSLILYNMGLIKLKQNDYAEGYQLLKRAVTLDEQHGFNNLSKEKDFLDQLEGILKNN